MAENVGREWTRPLRVLAVLCPLQTSSIKSLSHRDATSTQQCHILPLSDSPTPNLCLFLTCLQGAWRC